MCGMMKLQVYITTDCWTCEVTDRIVADVTEGFSDLDVELLDMTNRELPDNVFAVPTYLLNGRVISLGNPTREELRRALLHEQNKVQL